MPPRWPSTISSFITCVYVNPYLIFHQLLFLADCFRLFRKDIQLCHPEKHVFLFGLAKDAASSHLTWNTFSIPTEGEGERERAKPEENEWYGSPKNKSSSSNMLRVFHISPPYFDYMEVTVVYIIRNGIGESVSVSVSAFIVCCVRDGGWWPNVTKHFTLAFVRFL